MLWGKRAIDHSDLHQCRKLNLFTFYKCFPKIICISLPILTPLHLPPEAVTSVPLNCMALLQVKVLKTLKPQGRLVCVFLSHRSIETSTTPPWSDIGLQPSTTGCLFGPERLMTFANLPCVELSPFCWDVLFSEKSFCSLQEIPILRISTLPNYFFCLLKGPFVGGLAGPWSPDGSEVRFAIHYNLKKWHRRHQMSLGNLGISSNDFSQ